MAEKVLGCRLGSSIPTAVLLSAVLPSALGMLLPQPSEDSVPGQGIDVGKRSLAGVLPEETCPSSQHGVEFHQQDLQGTVSGSASGQILDLPLDRLEARFVWIRPPYVPPSPRYSP